MAKQSIKVVSNTRRRPSGCRPFGKAPRGIERKTTMTNEQFETMKARIWSGLDMISEKAQKIGQEENAWSLDELGKMADITKDLAKAFKCLVKINILANEHSVKRY